jgi:hypothetical protein
MSGPARSAPAKLSVGVRGTARVTRVASPASQAQSPSRLSGWATEVGRAASTFEARGFSESDAARVVSPRRLYASDDKHEAGHLVSATSRTDRRLLRFHRVVEQGKALLAEPPAIFFIEHGRTIVIQEEIIACGFMRPIVHRAVSLRRVAVEEESAALAAEPPISLAWPRRIVKDEVVVGEVPADRPMAVIRRRASALLRVAVEEHRVAVLAARPFLLNSWPCRRLTGVDSEKAKARAQRQETHRQAVKVPPAGMLGRAQ